MLAVELQTLDAKILLNSRLVFMINHDSFKRWLYLLPGIEESIDGGTASSRCEDNSDVELLGMKPVVSMSYSLLSGNRAG